MPGHVTLSMDFSCTDVSNYDTLSTGAMGGCVTVIVHGAHGTRAQHCAGGFQALDHSITNVGTIRTIVVAAPMLTGNDPLRVLEWVAQNKGTGRSMFVKNSCRIDLRAMRNGTALPSCVSY